MRLKPFFILLFLLLILPSGLSTLDVTLEPENLWVNERMEVRAVCNLSSEIQEVYAIVDGPTFLKKDFEHISGNLYKLTLDSSIGELEVGSYSLRVNCSSSNGSVTKNLNFVVSTFEGSVSVSSLPLYEDEIIELKLTLKKDDNVLDSSFVDYLSFSVYLNDISYTPNTTYFDQNEGNWVIKIGPLNEGFYEVTVLTTLNLPSYNPKNLSLDTSFNVDPILQFNILSIDDNWFKSGENRTLRINAWEKGNSIDIKKEWVKLYVGSERIDEFDLRKVGNYFEIEFEPPPLLPGSYKVKIQFSYENYPTVTKEVEIYYITPVRGKLTNLDNKPIRATMDFYQRVKLIKSFGTNSNGEYSGEIPPGIYDIYIQFPFSKVKIEDAEIEEFEDPIRYSYFDFDIEGIKVSRGFVFELAFPFSSVTLQMDYNERKVRDENSLEVFRCENWNSGMKRCNGKWEEVDASIDKIRNLVEVTTTSLSSFVIGNRKHLRIQASIDKNVHYLEEEVRVNGIVVDDDGNVIPEVSLNLEVERTSINISTKTDSKGIFTLSFISPGKEGNYTIRISAKKEPYLEGSSEKSFQVVRSKQISILFPDTVRMKAGETSTVKLTLVNIGQYSFDKVLVSIDGIPSSYYSIEDFVGGLKEGEEKEISVTFSIPKNATKGTFAGKVKVEGDGYTKQQIFGFTVEEGIKIINETKLISPLPTASFVLGFMKRREFTFLFIFAIASFSTSYILKKRKKKLKSRKEIENFLLSVKEEIRKKKPEELLKKKKNETKKIEKKVEEVGKLIERARSRIEKMEKINVSKTLSSLEKSLEKVD